MFVMGKNSILCFSNYNQRARGCHIFHYLWYILAKYFPKLKSHGNILPNVCTLVVVWCHLLLHKKDLIISCFIRNMTWLEIAISRAEWLNAEFCKASEDLYGTLGAMYKQVQVATWSLWGKFRKYVWFLVNQKICLGFYNGSLWEKDVFKHEAGW